MDFIHEVYVKQSFQIVKCIPEIDHFTQIAIHNQVQVIIDKMKEYDMCSY